MGDNSAIEWTDATWNPVRGCAIVSKGCTNCYAMRQAHRSHGAGGAYAGLTKLTKGGPVWTGEVRTVPQLLDQPLRWRRPRRIFVNSMSDLFHEGIHPEFIGSVLGIAAACPQHTFQVLTKRPGRALDVLCSRLFLEAYESSLEMYTNADVPWPAPNVWLGVSVEDQAAADERIPRLLQLPAAVRWISAEPLLGPIDIFNRATGDLEYSSGDSFNPGSIDWIVAGGESGPGARPMHPDWVRSLRDQCAAAHDGVPFFFKQWGAWAPYTYVNRENGHKLVRLGYTKTEERRERVIGGPAEGTEPFNVRRIGKKTAGRELDGRTHDEYPVAK